MPSMTLERPVTDRAREALHPVSGRGGGVLDGVDSNRNDDLVTGDWNPQRAAASDEPASTEYADALMRTLYAEHAGPLLAFVLRLTGGDRQRAEDIVQETLLRAWRNAHRLNMREGTSPRPWLVTVARRI